MSSVTGSGSVGAIAHSSEPISTLQPAAKTRVRTRIVKIGNSQGVRIPKLVLEQLGMGGEVELLIESGQLVIRNVQPPRHDWAAQFKQMAACGDDALLDDPTPTDWDEDWTW